VSSAVRLLAFKLVGVEAGAAWVSGAVFFFFFFFFRLVSSG
jgi:hypothetical protein